MVSHAGAKKKLLKLFCLSPVQEVLKLKFAYWMSYNCTEEAVFLSGPLGGGGGGGGSFHPYKFCESPPPPPPPNNNKFFFFFLDDSHWRTMDGGLALSFTKNLPLSFKFCL